MNQILNELLFKRNWNKYIIIKSNNFFSERNQHAVYDLSNKNSEFNKIMLAISA